MTMDSPSVFTLESIAHAAYETVAGNPERHWAGLRLTEQEGWRAVVAAIQHETAIRHAEQFTPGYTDRAGIDARANSALLAIDAISSDYGIPAAVRLVLVAQRMASEPILTDTASEAYAVREQAAAYIRNRSKS